MPEDWCGQTPVVCMWLMCDATDACRGLVRSNSIEATEVALRGTVAQN